MSRFVLFGLPNVGKSTIMYTYRGKKTPQRPTDKDWVFKIKSMDFVREYGGNMVRIDKLLEKLENANKIHVLYVFRGKHLLEQIQNHKEGGEVYSRWLYFSKQSTIDRYHFVATFITKDIEEMGSIENVEESFRVQVNKANEEYKKVLSDNSVNRYDNRFFNSLYFHCINIEDKTQVDALFAKIKETDPAEHTDNKQNK